MKNYFNLFCFIALTFPFFYSHLQKYAPLFDQEKIGMIELPYLTEEKMKTMGLPMGPRIRIMQEAQLCIRSDNISDYGMV